MNELYQFLNQKQKDELGKAIFDKLVREVENIKISSGTINLAKLINDDLKGIIDNGDGLINYEHTGIIGEAAAKAIAAKIKEIIK